MADFCTALDRSPRLLVMQRLILQGTFGAHGGRPYAGCDAVHAARPAGSGLLPAGGRPPVAQAWAPGALVHDRAPGQPLDPQTRREMEDLYGESFAGVSIHHSIEPCSLGARAVTLGERIYFAPGEYQPQSSRGAVLLGRELSHVSQQRQLVAARRCDRVPIIRHPWLEAEASYRGSELLARRGRSQPQVVMRSSSKLKVGVAVGGLVLGTIALYALGKYLWSAWSSQGSQQPPRDNPANTMDPFQLAWSATQADARTDLPALGDVLIISEAGPEKDRTGRLVIEVSTSITRTYYPDFWFRKNSSKLDDSWLVWDWTSGDFPARRSLDTIITRSMICACEDEHFEGGLGPQAKGAAI